MSRFFRLLLDRRQTNATARVQSQAPFSQKRQEVYFKLVGVTATLGNNDSSTQVWRDAALRFWELYWGTIPMVVDRRVALRVDAFSEILSPETDGVVLRNASMDLARECRAALGNAWNVALEELPRASLM